MPTIHLIEGPVGAGKSTYAAKMMHEHSAPRLNLDEWMVVLFRPDRPEGEDIMAWYSERKQRCIEQIWYVAQDLLDTGSDVILEMGLIFRQDREDFYARVDALDVPLKVYVLDAPKEVRRERVQRRNEEQSGTFKMVVPDEIFEFSSNAWQEPDEEECAARDIRFINTA